MGSVEPEDDDDDLDIALQEIQRLIPGRSSVPLTPASPPSDAGKDFKSRVTYLRTICSNHHFRLVLDWLSRQKVGISALANQSYSNSFSTGKEYRILPFVRLGIMGVYVAALTTYVSFEH